MSEAKTYKKQEVSEDYVAEPMAMKYSAVAEDAGYLNDDILVDAIKYTQTAREKGQRIRPFHVVIATIRNFSEHSFQFGQPPIFRHRIKARAFLHRIQVMMPHYQNFRKNPFQFAQQCH